MFDGHIFADNIPVQQASQVVEELLNVADVVQCDTQLQITKCIDDRSSKLQITRGALYLRSVSRVVLSHTYSYLISYIKHFITVEVIVTIRLQNVVNLFRISPSPVTDGLNDKS